MKNNQSQDTQKFCHAIIKLVRPFAITASGVFNYFYFENVYCTGNNFESCFQNSAIGTLVFLNCDLWAISMIFLSDNTSNNFLSGWFEPVASPVVIVVGLIDTSHSIVTCLIVIKCVHIAIPQLIISTIYGLDQTFVNMNGLKFDFNGGTNPELK